MKIRTFLYIAVGMIILSIIGISLYSNYEVLNRPFFIYKDFNLPISVIILLAFLTGMVLTLLAGLAREIRSIFGRFRRWKEEKLLESLEEKYFEGLEAIAEGRSDKALKHFQSILEKDHKHFNALLKMGDVLCTLKRYKEAIEYHKKAYMIKEEDTRPLYCLSDDYEAMGDLKQAKNQLNKIIDLKPRTAISAYRKLRQIYMKEEKWEEALDANRRVKKLLERLAIKATKDERFNVGIKYQIGLKQFKEGEEKDAINQFKKIIKSDPQFIPAYIELGEVYKALDQEGTAVEIWKKGFEVTNSPIFLRVLENHFLEKEQPFEAIETLKTCISKLEKDIIPRFFLGRLYYRLEMLDEALDTLKSLEDRASYAPTLHFLLGRIHERRKNFEGAVDELKKVIKQAELMKLEYVCFACQARLADWYDRCPECGEWNNIEVDMKENISYEELGISPAPVYTSKD